jgi:farnesyl-diphosphate farnesyltransferase
MKRKTLDSHLERVSRTFALTINFLNEPLKYYITLSYLIFRVSDTLEDSTEWPQEKKAKELTRFANFLQKPKMVAARQMAEDWSRNPPVLDGQYANLMKDFEPLCLEIAQPSQGYLERILTFAARSAIGMAEFASKSNAKGILELADLKELNLYCYYVAGIVGESLTELFILDEPILEKVSQELRQRSKAFGEALQLTNIIKDQIQDAKEGRSFLPASVPIQTVMNLAREDIEIAKEYVRILQDAGASHFILEFTAIPILLAEKALDAVEKNGSGAKVSRGVVYSTVSDAKNLIRNRVIFPAARKAA